MLVLDKVNSYYEMLHVLWDVDLRVESGEITGIIGPNGSGKSTLLKTILGIVPPFSGEITLDGKRISGLSPKAIVRSGIVYVPEGRRIFPEMTVGENIMLGVMTPKARKERDASLAQVFRIFPLLQERRAQMGGTLSGGELQLLALARGLMASPDLLMIDEPSLGLSPIAVDTVFRMIKEISKLGKTILIVEQNVPRLLTLASKIYVLENGRIATSGTASELRHANYISKSYLGM